MKVTDADLLLLDSLFKEYLFSLSISINADALDQFRVATVIWSELFKIWNVMSCMC